MEVSTADSVSLGWQYIRTFFILFPIFVIGYFSFTGFLYYLMWHEKNFFNVKLNRLQPRAAPHTWSVMWEEAKWSTCTLFVGAIYISMCVVAQRNGYSKSYFDASQYGYTYYFLRYVL